MRAFRSRRRVSAATAKTPKPLGVLHLLPHHTLTALRGSVFARPSRGLAHAFGVPRPRAPAVSVAHGSVFGARFALLSSLRTLCRSPLHLSLPRGRPSAALLRRAGALAHVRSAQLFARWGALHAPARLCLFFCKKT